MAEAERGIMIQDFQPSRIDDLVEAQNRIFADYMVPVRSTRSFFIDFLKSVGGSLGNIIVALDEDMIVGYVNPVSDGGEGWIGGIGVLPKYRGAGIGTKLMAAAEAKLRDRGVRSVQLEVIEGNTRAQRLYNRLGYDATRRFFSAEGRPARFEGFGEPPRRASLADVLPVHASSYRDACWQRRKADALIQSARGAEMYRTDGGFVMVRIVETTGFIPFLGVAPDRRRQGIGTSLARFALTRLHEMGAFKASIFNVTENEANLRMADLFDFKVTLKQIEMQKTI